MSVHFTNISNYEINQIKYTPLEALTIYCLQYLHSPFFMAGKMEVRLYYM